MPTPFANFVAPAMAFFFAPTTGKPYLWDPLIEFLTEIPDFGGDSLRNHPEPEGNFGNFPRAEGPREISKISRGRGVISANPRQNQEFLLNSGFCTSFAISTNRSTLPWSPGVSIFSKYVGIQLSQSSTCLIVQNTIL